MTTLKVEGEVDAPAALGFSELAALPGQIEDIAALVPGRKGGGVRIGAVLEAARARATARWVTLAAADGSFAISVPRDLIAERGIVVYRLGDAPLPDGSGGPLRVLLTGAPATCAGELDTCAAVKGLGLVRLTAEREPDVGHEHHG